MDLMIDGVRYTSWDDVPADLRQGLLQAFGDEDGDGIPDLEGPGQAVKTSTTTTTTSVAVDGVEYTSADDMPADVRAMLRDAGVPLPGAAPRRTNDSPVDTRRPRRWWQVWRRS